ncbi:sigma factor [Devosia sediminis]|uniref:Transcriptional regulator n=1 Tax=Devosia sediminis TaxID=2798801 RepID=A0A934MLS1_9HYPH|nr:sigma factor [Devosia sediminis]MBJ3786543.1 transcriptional regulator [Devosia sediminis]
MRTALYARLTAIARRHAGAGGAEDIVQDAMLLAVEAGRFDLASPENVHWLGGVVRNRARMAARSARRAGRRDQLWQESRAAPEPGQGAGLAETLDGLPPALRTFAALVLTGHNRREIAYLLDLPDTALRQRVTALRRHLVSRGLAAPGELSGLYLDLAYGRIRDCLLPALLRHGGAFASHDPDGHLFVVRRSQSGPSRQ